MTLAAHEEIVDAEIVPTKMEAVASIERAIEHAEGFWKEILWQVQNRVWEALNYESFDALWEHRYAGLGVRIDRRDRPELVAELRQIGQTQQEIADKLGVEHRTVKRDVAELRSKGHLSHSEPTITNSRGQSRPATYKKKEKENGMPTEVMYDGGRRKAFREDDGTLTFPQANDQAAAEVIRGNPDLTNAEVNESVTGNAIRGSHANRVRQALRENGEIQDTRPNKLVERFDSIAQGLTYVADDLESLTADLERATAEDLEFGREYFEDAMKKLNAFRKQLNAKY